jgi:hypothetical protein
MTPEEVACHLHHPGTSSPWLGPATPLTLPTQRPLGLQRSSIASWAFASSEITNIFCKSVEKDNGLMAASFLSPLALMQQFQRPNVVAS